MAAGELEGPSEEAGATRGALGGISESRAPAKRGATQERQTLSTLGVCGNGRKGSWRGEDGEAKFKRGALVEAEPGAVRGAGEKEASDGGAEICGECCARCDRKLDAWAELVVGGVRIKAGPYKGAELSTEVFAEDAGAEVKLADLGSGAARTWA